jgi:ATP-dependent exoDNAse (exonuclease V) alpha subunit
LIGDAKQFQSIEQGKIFADLQEHAKVSKAEVVEIKRQETQHAREIVKAIKDRDFEKAYNSLEQRGAFREIENCEERNRRVVDEYLSDRKAGVYSVILTSANADRDDINKQVRERLESGGEVDSGKEYQTWLWPLNLGIDLKGSSERTYLSDMPKSRTLHKGTIQPFY